MHIFNLDEAFQQCLPSLASEFENKGFALRQHQKETILNLMTNGNTLCIMPTGGGKSLIYWLSGLMLDGITIVVFPLVSLIDEQQEKLREQGIDVLALHGHIGSAKQVELMIDFANGILNPKFIFVSPEKLATDGFFEYCIRARKKDIKLITIDEVHCVSQWGASFRPFYRRIPDFIENVFSESYPKILAMTATINPKELNDICDEFHIYNSNIIKDQSLMRTEITLHTLKFNNENEKDDKLWDLLKIHNDEKILVYVYRVSGKRSVEELSLRANSQHGLRSVCFHGEMSASERREVITRYKNNEINIVFATNAFGMGIDIPDIRVVIHFMIPESVEQYYQEIGRAARDKGAANAYLLYSNKNIEIKRRHFIDASYPNRDELVRVFKKIPKSESGLQTLPYFDDEEIQHCLLYFDECEAIKIIGKGFSDLRALTDIKDAKLAQLVDLTKTKLLVRTAKKAEIDVLHIVDLVYSSIVKGSAKTLKPLDRRLLISVLENELAENQLDEIITSINQKRLYKHSLLDYLIFILDNNKSSIELHQEIARYLGVDKHMLNRMYATSKGDMVRSKSEVIIANLLYQYGINYEYEKHLNYKSGKWIEPDFTITLDNGKEIYWEHLGLLGLESYDNNWLFKIAVYEEYYPGQLVKTYEGTTITDSTIELIHQIKNM